MKRWEYKTDSLSGVYGHILNEYGKDGWELVIAIYDRGSMRYPYKVVFKREIVK